MKRRNSLDSNKKVNAQLPPANNAAENLKKFDLLGLSLAKDIDALQRFLNEVPAEKENAGGRAFAGELKKAKSKSPDLISGSIKHKDQHSAAKPLFKQSQQAQPFQGNRAGSSRHPTPEQPQKMKLRAGDQSREKKKAEPAEVTRQPQRPLQKSETHAKPLETPSRAFEKPHPPIKSTQPIERQQLVASINQIRTSAPMHLKSSPIFAKGQKSAVVSKNVPIAEANRTSKGSNINPPGNPETSKPGRAASTSKQTPLPQEPKRTKGQEHSKSRERIVSKAAGKPHFNKKTASSIGFKKAGGFPDRKNPDSNSSFHYVNGFMLEQEVGRRGIQNLEEKEAIEALKLGTSHARKLSYGSGGKSEELLEAPQPHLNNFLEESEQTGEKAFDFGAEKKERSDGEDAGGQSEDDERSKIVFQEQEKHDSRLLLNKDLKTAEEGVEYPSKNSRESAREGYGSGSKLEEESAIPWQEIKRPQAASQTLENMQNESQSNLINYSQIELPDNAALTDQMPSDNAALLEQKFSLQLDGSIAESVKFREQQSFDAGSEKIYDSQRLSEKKDSAQRDPGEEGERTEGEGEEAGLYSAMRRNMEGHNGAVLLSKLSLAEELKVLNNAGPISNTELTRENSNKYCFKLDEYDKSDHSSSPNKRAELIQVISQSRESFVNHKSGSGLKIELKPASTDEDQSESLNSGKSTGRQFKAVYKKGSSFMEENRSKVAAADDAVSPRKTGNLESLFRDMKPLSANNSFEVVLEEENGSEESKMKKSQMKEPEEELFIVKKPVRQSTRFMLSSQRSLLSENSDKKETKASNNALLIANAKSELESLSRILFQKHKKEFLEGVELLLRQASQSKKILKRKELIDKTLQDPNSPIKRRTTNDLIDLPVNIKLLSRRESNISQSSKQENSINSQRHSFVNLNGDDSQGESLNNLNAFSKENKSKFKPLLTKEAYKETETQMLQENTFKFEDKAELPLDNHIAFENELELAEFLLMGFWGIRTKVLTRKQMSIRKTRVRLEETLNHGEDTLKNLQSYLDVFQCYLVESELVMAEQIVEQLEGIFEAISNEEANEQMASLRTKFLTFRGWFNILRATGENILKRVYHMHIASYDISECRKLEKKSLLSAVALIILEGQNSFSFSATEKVEKRIKELTEIIPAYGGLFEILKNAFWLDFGDREAIKKSLDFCSKAIQEGGNFVFICAMKLIYHFRRQRNFEKALSVIGFIQRKDLIAQDFHKEIIWSLYIKCFFSAQKANGDAGVKDIIGYLEKNNQKLLLFYQFARCIAKHSLSHLPIAINALDHVILKSTGITDEEAILCAKLLKAKLYRKCILNKAANALFKEVSANSEIFVKNAKAKQATIESHLEQFGSNLKNFNTVIKLILEGEREDSIFSELWKSFQRDKSINELMEYDDFAYKVLETALQKKELRYFEDLASLYPLRYEAWLLYCNQAYAIYKKYNTEWVLGAKAPVGNSNPVLKFKESMKFQSSWQLHLGQYIGLEPSKFWAFAGKPHYGELTLDESFALMKFKCYTRFKAQKGLMKLWDFIKEKKTRSTTSILTYYLCKGYIKIRELVKGKKETPAEPSSFTKEQTWEYSNFFNSLPYSEIQKSLLVLSKQDSNTLKLKIKSLYYIALGNMVEENKRSEVEDSIQKFENCIKSVVKKEERILEKLQMLKKRLRDLNSEI